MGAGRVSRLVVVSSLLVASVVGPARAAGPKPDKMQCITADTEGQSLRLSGKLLLARKRLSVCAATSCPGIVRDDCLQRIAELEAVLPTVLFTATNGYGRPLVAVRVTVDGELLTDRLDGRPLPVDPGEHVFAFEALGRLAARMQLTLSEGDTKVRHAVVLHTESGDPVDEVPAPGPPTPIATATAVRIVAPAVAPSSPSEGFRLRLVSEKTHSLCSRRHRRQGGSCGLSTARNESARVQREVAEELTSKITLHLTTRLLARSYM